MKPIFPKIRVGQMQHMVCDDVRPNWIYYGKCNDIRLCSKAIGRLVYSTMRTVEGYGFCVHWEHT